MQNLSSLKNQCCLCSNTQNAIIIKGLIVDKNYYNDPHTTCSSQVIIRLEYSNPQVNFLSQGIKYQAKV